MEGNSLRNKLKQHSMSERPMKDHNNNNKSFKDSWEYGRSENQGGDSLGGYSCPWPPRSYNCSFCKREFRSAQALGGHMNVHRRERARLRQSPPRNGQYCPFLNLNLTPNPNPNPNPDNPSLSQPSPSPSTRFLPLTSTLPPFLSPSLSYLSSTSTVTPPEVAKWDSNSTSFCDLTRIKSSKSLLRAGEFEGFTRGSEYKVLKEAEIVKLELGIGLVHDSKEDLDLELRLGCS